MAECNSFYNTPARHEELSISRKSLRARVLISCKESKNSVKNKGNKRLVISHVLSSTRISETPSFSGTKEEEHISSDSHMWEESSLKVDITQRQEAVSEEDMDSFSSDSCDHMEASIIHHQKHSTPQDMKFSIVRAVSSTPNQEVLNMSKFTKNVFTQTNFTLNVRDEDEMSGDLKSYCTEVPGDGSLSEQNKESSFVFNSTNGLTSPLSHLCSSQLDKCEGTPIKNNQFVRKLSLRSKTMICSAIEKSKDIPKKILSRHKSMEDKLFSNTFSLMPQHKTPPSYRGKVFHNPFEVDLPDKLSKTIFSPDVFDNVVSPSQESGELRWTIEDISSINPVPIDEDFSVPSDEDDPERESRVQQEIDRYFSETHFVLSPDYSPKSTSIVEIIQNNFLSGAAASTPRKVNVNVSKELKTSGTQTTLSLPAVLSADLEESLRSYFKYFETDEFNQSQCNLRRKLFFHTEDEPPSPVRFEIKSSPLTKDMWKAESSPLYISCRERHFTPVGRQQELSSPEMSPVVDEYCNPKLKNNSAMTCKKTLHNFFLGDTGGIQTERKKGVMNSSVTTSSDIDSSCLPANQDTGYHTEDSVSSHLHFSTPTRSAM